MRNLKLISTSSWCPDNDFVDKNSVHSSLGITEEMMDDKYIFMARGYCIIRLAQSSNAVKTMDLSTEIPLSDDEVLLTVQPVFDLLVIVTTYRGLSCNLNLEGLESIREFPVAVVGAVWSPDLQTVAIVTADERLMFANGSDLMENGPDSCDLNPQHFGKAELVNVGWGKKETQFHGKEGKAAAKRTIQAPSGLAPLDSRRLGLTWQSDSELLAVSTVDLSTSRRILRIWTVAGELYATGEEAPGSLAIPEGGAMAWRGSSNRVATSVRRMQSGAPPEVLFYERNGLQHRQMGARFTAEVDDVGGGCWRVAALAWNAAVDILAVGLEQLAASASGDDDVDGADVIGETARCRKVQIWTTGNRHWYRKYELAFPESDRIVAMAWDPTEVGQLHLLSESGAYRRIEWCWTTDVSTAPQHGSVVAVIDGPRLLITPFHGYAVPPPMAGCSLKVPCSVLAVAFATFASRQNDMALLLADGRLLLVTMASPRDGLELPKGGSQLMDGVELISVTCQGGPRPHSVRQLLPPGSLPYSVAHLTWTPNGLEAVESNSGDIVRIALSDDSDECTVSRCPSPSDADTLVGACWPLCPADVEGGCLFLQDESGRVWSKGDAGDWKQVTRFPSRCDQWCVLRRSLPSSGDSNAFSNICLGLQSKLNKLVANGVVLTTDCTSFQVHNHGEFLVTTTTRNFLQCLPLSLYSSAQDLRDGTRNLFTATAAADQESKASIHNELVRAVERGSLLVTSVAAEAKVILQMPRGNLETIYPRALVLSRVRHSIDNGDYRAAYQLMRRHRINMNLLFDHDFARFLTDPAALVWAVGEPDDINMVLAELSDEDLTQTLYADHYRRLTSRSHAAQQRPADKVRLVCDRVEALSLGRLDRYLTCVITCYAKRRPRRLEKALQMILSEQQRGVLGQATLDKALRTLSYYVDINELYRLALGTYNFDVVMLVLNNSSLDPREHLPFLEELRSFPEDYRRFRIDVHNENFTKAISHILPSREASHFEEALQLVKQHNLYPQALHLYPLDQTHSDEYKTISRAFAERLRHQERGCSLEEAGRVLLRCGEAREAARCFLGACNWRKWAVAVGMAGTEPAELRSEARTLASSLQTRGDFDGAAHVFARFAGDPEAAVAAAAAGGLWDCAVALAQEHARTDLVEAAVRPRLGAAREECEERAAAVEAEFQQRADRLAAVRREHEARVLQEQQRAQWEDEAVGGVGADLYSETTSIPESSVSSTASWGSRASSSRTGKSRRKAQRKRWNFKEGSEYEEVALVERLHQLAQQANGLKAEAAALSAALVDFSLVAEASRLTARCGRLLLLVRRRRDEVWPEAAPAKEGVFERLSGRDALQVALGETDTTRRRFPDIREAFLYFPPPIEAPPAPSPLVFSPPEDEA